MRFKICKDGNKEIAIISERERLIAVKVTYSSLNFCRAANSVGLNILTKFEVSIAACTEAVEYVANAVLKSANGTPSTSA